MLSSKWASIVQVILLVHLNGNECRSNQFDLKKNCSLRLKMVERYGLKEELYENCLKNKAVARYTRRVDSTFRGKPRPLADVLAAKFHVNINNFDQTKSLVELVNKIGREYLAKCPPVIYYDNFVEKSEGRILEILFKTFPVTFYHGEINAHYVAKNTRFTQRIDTNCKSYILFLSDPLMTRNILGAQTESLVVVVARSTQWKVRDFLSSELSSNIVNLLVIGESLTADPMHERPYVLYTHKLYIDGLGSNTPVVLTSWISGALTRPHVNLYPRKFTEGFAGHRFKVSAANQPPFIFRMRSLDQSGIAQLNWDGVEYRLLNMIAKRLNFSIDINETPNKANSRGVVDIIQKQVQTKTVDMGMSGIYLTDNRLEDTDMSVGHSRDCASFITLASKALPKYRAIMGPFQWPVWALLVCVYLLAIFPIVYTDRLTLSHLLGNWGEIENMFWYVFGMFTNSFTFAGKYSWSSTQKTSTRLLIGSYWIFTIIITACYTGSIIAFVTLPAFPDTVDSVNDLLGLFFRVGTLDNGGWESWFQNSTHVPTAKLYKKMEFVSTVEEGIGNVTQSFFWNYAFLGSKAQLEYLVQANFSNDNMSRRSALHLSEECFALFQISYIYPKKSVYKSKIDSMILLAQQSGLINKIENEVSWAMQRSSSGKLLQASSSNALRERIQEERQLTTADTEGMFLLMGIGYILGAIALVSEIVGGITNKCRQMMSRKSAASSCSSSPDKGLQRSATHDTRKEPPAKNKVSKHLGLGLSEINLTRTTIRELYGNYYKREPNYLIKNGQLLVENEALSVNTTGPNSRDSSGEVGHCKHKTRAIVLAQVDVNNILQDDIHQTLGDLDEYLDGQDKESSLNIDSQHDDIVFGKIVAENNSEVRKTEKLNLYSL